MMITDSKLKFDVVTGNRYTNEDLLMVDVASGGKAYNQNVSSNNALISTEQSIADSLTTVMAHVSLEYMMGTGYIALQIQ